MSRYPNLPSVPDSESESDASLLAQISQGNEQAMERLFSLYSRVVYSVALRVLRDPELAEDILQEVFMRIWQKPISFMPERGNLSSLLAVMTRNRCIDQIRSRKPQSSVDDLQLAAPFNLAEASEHSILLERVRDVVKDLPEDQQSALSLAFFEGLTHSEIAEKTGAPLGTIKTRIRTALQRLERTFGE